MPHIDALPLLQLLEGHLGLLSPRAYFAPWATSSRTRPTRALPDVAPLAARLRPDALDEFVGQAPGRRPGLRARARDRGGPGRLGDLLRAAGERQDDARAHRRAHDRRGLRGALGRVGLGRRRARRARPRPRAARAAAGSGRSSSSTRSTASTRRSRTRSCRRSRSGLVTLIGATTENPYFEVNSALLSRTQIYELEPLSERGGGRDRRGAAPTELGAEVPDELVRLIAAQGRRRRPRSPQHPRARLADGAGGGRPARGAPRRGRRPQAAARLRQGRRRALRLHLGVHQVDPRLRPRRGALLPGGDARGRRGRALRRAPPDRPRLRGHRQRRLARAARRDGRGARGRARRPARGAAQPRAGDDLPRPRAQVERRHHRARRGDERRARARDGPAAQGAPRHALPRRDASSATARATSTRRTTRAGYEVDYLPDELQGPDVLRAARRRRASCSCTCTSGATRARRASSACTG